MWVYPFFSLNLADKTQIKSEMESNFSGFDFEINFKLNHKFLLSKDSFG